MAALLAVSGTGVDAFSPSRLPGSAARTTSTSLDAKSNDTFEGAARRVAGTGAAFFAGVSFAGQIAFADPNAVIASPIGKWCHSCIGVRILVSHRACVSALPILEISHYASNF